MAKKKSKSAKKPKAALSELENKVMKVVWKNPDITAEQVRMKLVRTHPLADSTVRTILRRLTAKGFVKHEVVGRTYVYRPVKEKQTVAVDAVRSIIERFCNGSVESLLVGMIDSDVVSAEKLQALVERIEQSKEESDND